MKNLTIKNIAHAVGGELYVPLFTADKKLSGEASGVFIDSRLCGENSVFVAIKGERSDGHDYIKDVFAEGALCVICEHLPEEYPSTDASPDVSDKPHGKKVSNSSKGSEQAEYGPCIVVKSSAEALKKLAAYYRSTLDIRIVGIVGSMGKTSTKEMVASVLSQHFNTHKTSGNFNNEIGVPLTLLAIREEHEIAVVEMGISDFGEMDRLGAIVRPDAVVMTNIGPCHLEFLHDLDGVLKAKSEVFKHIPKNGLVVLNGADKKLNAIREVRGCRIAYYNTTPEASIAENNGSRKGNSAKIHENATTTVSKDCKTSGRTLTETQNSCISADNIKSLGLLGTSFRLITTAGCIDTTVHLPGTHCVTNAQAAAAVGLEFGLSLKEIAAGIEAVKPVQGRGYVEQVGKFTIIDDCYNANPESVKAALDLLKTAKGRKCAILGDMFELGENSAELHASVGEYAARKRLSLIIFIGEQSQNAYAAYTAYSALNRRRKLPSLSKTSGKKTTLDATPKAMYFKTLDAFFEFYKTIPFKKGDNILIKASHGMHFDKILAFFKENAIL
ncbi:MAG: UDP-N-acetylmuramoyl-tripeptide--D-alanyl-D-alanine ligase [Lachnospiraceae bacterium]|nr:UDP-N-acetylmuramoyl-tripeptide--D-alanyl-D-alanine ligase [Lachnospiraceae bacterium]